MGMPAMGVVGAGLGTLIARIVELFVLLVLTVYIKSPVKIELARLFKIDKSLIKTFMQKGYGLVANEFFWAFGIQSLTVIYTMRISENIAVMSIAQTFAKLIWVGIGGMSVVFSIYLGEHLGKNEFELAKSVAKKLKVLGAVIGISLGITVLIISFFLMSFFDVTAEILTTGKIILIITVGFSWLNYLNSSYYFILRSGGDTKGVLLIDSLFTWVVMIPAAFLVGRFGFVLPLHFFIVQFFEFGKLILAHKLYLKGKWLNNLTVLPNTN